MTNEYKEKESKQMEGFDLSFRNPEVRVWITIMLPSFIIASLLLFLTDIPSWYATFALPFVSWISFFIWRFLYKRRQVKDSLE
ncbi:hypothetical protein [Sporosarcina luteola]|uniref:hypothetical protein n=1 Tax=Sporosarcina luteola TaxID=582850 RepID=UPI00203D0527|nr:hypothetical protein [Sporosarcina luteola]MCM3709849.1 hypothetical protein [Sporosarcina luteola]